MLTNLNDEKFKACINKEHPLYGTYLDNSRENVEDHMNDYAKVYLFPTPQS